MAALAIVSAGLWSCEKEDNVDSVVQDSVPANPDPDPDPDTLTVGWVDLGLPSGLLWAECNLGANAPEEYGNYYAWGDTAMKEVYSWSTYCYCTVNDEDSLQTLTKYNTSSTYGTPDDLTILQAADDAATANWGDDWRMPTLAEWQELCNNCYIVWTSNYNSTNVAGFIIYKAKADGDKGQLVYSGGTPSASYSITDTHIFLPAAGYRYGSSLYDGGTSSVYWSSSLDESYSNGGHYFYFSSGSFDPWYGGYRCCGQSVRPVCPAE